MDNNFERSLIQSVSEAVQSAPPRGGDPNYVSDPPEFVDAEQVRLSLGLTQAAFARRFGLSRTSVVRWEKGETKMDSATQLLYQLIIEDNRAVESAAETLREQRGEKILTAREKEVSKGSVNRPRARFKELTFEET